jgi:hypothetical protein
MFAGAGVRLMSERPIEERMALRLESRAVVSNMVTAVAGAGHRSNECERVDGDPSGADSESSEADHVSPPKVTPLTAKCSKE